MLRSIGRFLGVSIMAVWLPVLVAGLASLRSRGRLGRSEALIVTGAYRYVRHPLYAGLSMTLTGVGLLLGTCVLALGGLGWLLVTQLWSIHEERELAQRFGRDYVSYRRATPRVVPDVVRLLRDLQKDVRT